MKASTAKNETCWDWMRPEAASIQVDAAIEDAVLRMKKLQIHHLIVKDGTQYRGILDARDCAGVWDKDQKVQTIMRSNVPLVDENTDIKSVVRMIVDRGLTAVPMKRSQEVHGIITVTDLVRLLEAHLTHHVGLSELWNKGKDFLTEPIVQRLSQLLSGAGI